MQKERINGQVGSRVKIVTEGGLSEECSREEALDKAYEADKDLVEMSEVDGVSICKILDYQKFNYDRMKARQEANKGVKRGIKEIRFGSNISDHDLQIRANNTYRLVSGGYPVKVTLQVRGRNRGAQVESAKALMSKYEGMLDESIEIEKPSRVEGHNIVMYLKGQ